METAFLDMFSCCQGLMASGGGLDKAKVRGVVISRETMRMELSVWFAQQPAPAELAALAARIAAEFGLAAVDIQPDYPHEEPVVKAEPKKEKKDSKDKEKSDKPQGPAVYGKMPKERGKSIPMNTLGQDNDTVWVTGTVFMVENRAIAKTGALVLCFSVTDYTGSVRVSKYLRSKDDHSVSEAIHKGDRVTVAGRYFYNQYDGDYVLEPTLILQEPKVQRQDKAEEKRVELHLHTRFSALDALTDPGAAVKTAARWGHKAIAVTDHGVAQAFPDYWNAGKKNKIKVIYGLEGYYVNDVDDLPAIQGETDLPLESDFVGFDLETTGLNSEHDRITEIGGVHMSGGKVVRTFQTFVNPERPIPRDVTELTGITDRDVFDAPSEKEALAAFLEFVGDMPLVAHNAGFDIGFVSAAAERCGYDFRPVYIDTLALAQCLLPEMKRHKLDMVARTLGMPPFNHHRASDDATVCARIYEQFRAQLGEKGAVMLRDIGPVSASLRKGGSDTRHTRHIILLVKNKVGLKNLYELISKSHLEHFKKFPIIPKSLLMQYREGLIVGSACEAGEVFDAILRHRNASDIQRIASFYDFLEIQPICNNRFLVRKGQIADDEGLRDLNRKVVHLAKKLGKPVCATGDVHFLEPEDEVYRHILLASKKFADADSELPLYFKTTDEMLQEFSYLGEKDCYDAVIGNPNAIADSVEEFELLPKDLFPPTIENAAEDLERMVWDKTHELYGDEPPALVTDRIREELDAILGRHYEVIYMSAQKLVQNSLEHGYLVGSRGSVGSSMVAYMSGITEVNSLPPHYRCPSCRHTDFENVYREDGTKYGCGADMPDKPCPVCGTKLVKDGFDIPFETFLGFGGDKVPDIDLNFSGEYQGQAHKYTEELFGREHVFRAGTIGTLAEKTAYGYVKKYLEERGLTVSKAEENRLAAGCVGVKRTTGQHPGGLVIIPQTMDVTDFCPVQHPADDSSGGIITTHFEYHCMEANLLKLDELGHDDPTMIRMLEDATGVNAREIPLDDPDTMAIYKSPATLFKYAPNKNIPMDDPILGRTGTIGVPEFGTNFTRQMLVDTQPEQFDTLVRLSGFSHGTDVWAGNIRDLVVNGIADVNQCVGCRDDIMLYLIDKGMDPKRAFKFMEAVRKGAIHKGKPWPEGIEEEMAERGVPEWWIESCRKIQYLFPKAHAVAYVTMAFRIAWFKVHEPLAYYSAYFYRRSQKDGFDAASMTKGIDHCRDCIRAIQNNPNATAKDQDLLTTLESVYEFYLRGFEFHNIDIYKSHATKFLIEDGKLRPPFVSISGLGETAAQDLMNSQKSGHTFVSIDDVSEACPKVSQTHLEMLRNLGALGDLPESRQMNLFEFDMF